MPDLAQTMGSWTQKVGTDASHFVQDVFADDTLAEKTHRQNCVALIRKGYLLPEVDDGVPPYKRNWDPKQRYFPRW